MCTAITFQSKCHYFGRNLDFEYGFNECITVTPRNFPFSFRCIDTISQHYSMIGMATIENGYPLYFDATNEHGLSMAGLYFPGNAEYLPKAEGMDNIAPFEFIPWILGQCKDMQQVRQKLDNLNLIDLSFSEKYPLSPLHWIIADKTEAITVEPMKDGIQIYENPIGVLTNNPPFEYHMHNLCNYLNLTAGEAVNRFTEKHNLEPYSRGMGAIGLPGDLSSSSRFIRAAFVKLNSVCNDTENAAVSQFFHILNSVAQQNGCVKIREKYEKTIYSSCCNTDTGIYYYTTYENAQITGVNMHHTDLSGHNLTLFPLVNTQQIHMAN